MLEGKARLIIPTNKGNTGILYIPADLVKDSLFPFKPNETVHIRIEGDHLIIDSEKKRFT